MAHVDRNNPQRAASSESQYTLMEFMRDFPDDATCLEWLWRTLYSPDGEHAHCDRCGQQRRFARYDTTQRRQSWTCTTCGLHVHPTAGTIFHKSSTSLHLWFYAMYLMTSTRCGISAKQLEREIGVTYKTAWRMFHLIRHELMAQDEEPLSGVVEIDETYIGGRKRGRGRPGAKDRSKTALLGMAERGGRVAVVPVADATRDTLAPPIRKRVLPEAMIYTDEWRAYTLVGREFQAHRRVRHGAGVYVSGDVHTNTIEGFWALLKNGIQGVYHAVSAKHLLGFLSEYAWRWNHRADDQAMFLTLLLRAARP